MRTIRSCLPLLDSSLSQLNLPPTQRKLQACRDVSAMSWALPMNSIGSAKAEMGIQMNSTTSWLLRCASSKM